MSLEEQTKPSPTKAQLKRLYTIATDKGWTHDGVHALVWHNYRVQSTTELTHEQYDEVVKFLETSIVPNVVTMRRDPNTEDIFT